jgi:hypothetical protein
MTDLLDQAFKAVSVLPPDLQNDIARAMLCLARTGDEKLEKIDPAHLPDILESLAQAHRGDFATDRGIATVLNVKHAARERNYGDA